MKLNKSIIAVAILTTISATGCQTTKSTQQSLDSSIVDVNDSITSMKRGVLLMSEQVQVTNKQMKQQNESISSGLMAAGVATTGVGLYNNSKGAAIVGGAVGLVGLAAMIAEEASEHELIKANRYTVEYKDGGVIQVFQIDNQPIPMGSPVFVRTYSSGKVNVTLDKTEGVTFKRAKDTHYEGDEAVKAQAKAKADKKAAEEEADRQFMREQAKRRIEAETESQEILSKKTSSIIDANNESLKHSNEATININKN